MPQPNILNIIMDDIGYRRGNYHGIERDLSTTPNLRALAARGRLLERFYVTAYCVPTRCCYATGLLPHNSGYMLGNAKNPNCRVESDTLYSALAAAGYTLGHFGKWHVLTYDVTRCPHIAASYFDQYMVSIEAGVDGTEAEKRDRYWGSTIAEHTAPGGTSKLPNNRFTDDESVERAIDFMGSAPEPWYAQVWTWLCHRPFVRTPDTPGGKLSDRELYRHMLAYADALIGQLVAAAPADTLVVFTTDNGGPGPVGGDKGELTDGGIRVPCIVAHPTLTVPGREQRLASIVDLAPTLAAAAGATLTSTDGVDLAPLLMGTTGTPRSFAASLAFRTNWCVVDEAGWKLERGSGGGLTMVNTLRDPNESRALRASDLSPAQRQIWNALRAEAQRLDLM